MSQTDVTWDLRTRFDAIATMRVRQGKVTGWLVYTARLVHESHHYMIAQVENENAFVRALVTWEDLSFTLRNPLRLDDSSAADTVTDLKFDYETGGLLNLDVELWRVQKKDVELSCADVGLSRKNGSMLSFLPPKRGEVVVRFGTLLRVGDHLQDVGELSRGGGGVSEPRGALASVHQETETQLLLSLKTCGGWIYGWVNRTDVLGPPLSRFGSNVRCPNTGTGYGTISCGPEKQWVCSKAIPFFVRTDTLQDPIGYIKPGAQFWFGYHSDELKPTQAKETTRVVDFEESPVDTLSGSRLVVNVSDLEGCTEVKATSAQPSCTPKRKSNTKAPRVRLSAPMGTAKVAVSDRT